MGEATVRVRRRTAALALLAVGVVGGLVGGGAALVGGGAAQTFTDVPEDHPFFEEIQFLSDAGIAEGYGDGSFRPGDPVSRQAMAAFLARASTYQLVSVNASSSEDFVAAEAPCPAGTVVVGGGFDAESDVAIRLSVPLDDQLSGWLVIADRGTDSTGDIEITSKAICTAGTVSAVDEE